MIRVGSFYRRRTQMDPEHMPLSSPETLDTPVGAMPLEAAQFYATELARSVPELDGERVTVDDAAHWQEVVEEEDISDVKALGERVKARYAGRAPARYVRHLQLYMLRYDLEAAINRRLATLSGRIVSLLREHPQCRNTGDLATAGLLDAYRPVDFGLPYWSLAPDQVPPDLDEALVLRRWLAEHPPTAEARST
jgi:hypothetical protein